MPSANKITAAQLRKRLADTCLPADPVNVVMPPKSERWPGSVRRALTASLKPAGVLIPVIDHEIDLAVLLTQRSSALRHHAGQVSFPGGSMEPRDADITATALRETEEEVGIAPDDVSVIGYLEPMPTITGFAVTPTVGIIDAAQELRIDPGEVEFTFEVPLSFLFDERNAHTSIRLFHGQKLPVVEFRYETHRIWGATAHMLLRLREKVFNNN